MRIVGCPHAELAPICRTEQPSHLVTIASPGATLPTVAGSAARLHLAFHDIAGPRPGLVPASRDDVATLLAFGRSWSGEAPLVVSCELAVSRSPAAALALAGQACPDRDPVDLAAALRRASPQATPNLLVVAWADELLGLGGALAAAVAAVGRGADFAAPFPFRLDLAGPGRP